MVRRPGRKADFPPGRAGTNTGEHAHPTGTRPADGRNPHWQARASNRRQITPPDGVEPTWAWFSAWWFSAFVVFPSPFMGPLGPNVLLTRGTRVWLRVARAGLTDVARSVQRRGGLAGSSADSGWRFSARSGPCSRGSKTDLEMSGFRGAFPIDFPGSRTRLRPAFCFDLQAPSGYPMHTRDGTDDCDEREFLSSTDSSFGAGCRDPILAPGLEHPSKPPRRSTQSLLPRR